LPLQSPHKRCPSSRVARRALWCAFCVISVGELTGTRFGDPTRPHGSSHLTRKVGKESQRGDKIAVKRLDQAGTYDAAQEERDMIDRPAPTEKCSSRNVEVEGREDVRYRRFRFHRDVSILRQSAFAFAQSVFISSPERLLSSYHSLRGGEGTVWDRG